MKPNIFATIIDQNQSFIIGLWWENGSCKLGSSLVERIESWTTIGWLVCTVPRLSTFWWITDRLCGGGSNRPSLPKKSLVCTQLVITWTFLQGLIQLGLTETLSFFFKINLEDYIPPKAGLYSSQYSLILYLYLQRILLLVGYPITIC